jgi:homoserine kinase type II
MSGSGQYQRDDHPSGSGRAIGLKSPEASGLQSQSASGTPISPPQERAREQFDAGELAMVCSRYDVGVIESVKEFRRGSSRAPKVGLKTSQGSFLLKRRAAGAARSPRVALSHAVQSRLGQRGFPLPRLLGTRTDGRTALELSGYVYEVFEFVPGNTYDSSLDATGDAGRLLAHFHRMLESFDTRPFNPSTATFHNSRSLLEQLGAVADRLSEADRAVADRLRGAYADAAHDVEALGIAGWPIQLIHADWHPGNMVYKGSRVIAVIDYDTVRLAPRVVDIANGALQFSITRLSEDPDRWPAALDQSRFKRFCRGYDGVKNCVISTAELEAIPHLMVEALIVEAVAPIAATGSFAGLDAAAFLRMVDAKVSWLNQNAAHLTALASA